MQGAYKHSPSIQKLDESTCVVFRVFDILTMVDVHTWVVKFETQLSICTRLNTYTKSKCLPCAQKLPYSLTREDYPNLKTTARLPFFVFEFLSCKILPPGLKFCGKSVDVGGILPPYRHEFPVLTL